MKHKVFIILNLVCLIVMAGCVDYEVRDTYSIKNETGQSIFVSFIPFNDSQKRDTIPASGIKEIYSEFGLCGKNYVPQEAEILFEKFDLYYSDNVRVEKDYTKSDFWLFSNKEYEGNYVLKIDITALQ